LSAIRIGNHGVTNSQRAVNSVPAAEMTVTMEAGKPMSELLVSDALTFIAA